MRRERDPEPLLCSPAPPLFLCHSLSASSCYVGITAVTAVTGWERGCRGLTGGGRPGVGGGGGGEGSKGKERHDINNSGGALICMRHPGSGPQHSTPPHPPSLLTDGRGGGCGWVGGGAAY